MRSLFIILFLCLLESNSFAQEDTLLVSLHQKADSTINSLPKSIKNSNRKRQVHYSITFKDQETRSQCAKAMRKKHRHIARLCGLYSNDLVIKKKSVPTVDRVETIGLPIVTLAQEYGGKLRLIEMSSKERKSLR